MGDTAKCAKVCSCLYVRPRLILFLNDVFDPDNCLRISEICLAFFVFIRFKILFVILDRQVKPDPVPGLQVFPE